MKYLLTSFALLILSLAAKADTFWIETNLKGAVGKAQTIKVLFGSTISNKLQNVDGKFKEVKDFTCWVISPSGKLHYLKMVPADTAYECQYTPEENGVYTVLLENKLQKVEDWRNTASKIGITKQDYYARTNFIVGDAVDNSKSQTQTEVCVINERPEQAGSREMILQVFSHGKPVKNAAIFVRNPSKNEQKCITNENGEIHFTAPEPGRYVALITLRFEKPGFYKGVHYDVFREKASYTIFVE